MKLPRDIEEKEEVTCPPSMHKDSQVVSTTTSKREKRGAQRPKRPKGEQSSIANDVVNDPSPADVQLVRQ